MGGVRALPFLWVIGWVGGVAKLAIGFVVIFWLIR